jgi:hypothetical protein
LCLCSGFVFVFVFVFWFSFLSYPPVLVFVLSFCPCLCFCSCFVLRLWLWFVLWSWRLRISFALCKFRAGLVLVLLPSSVLRLRLDRGPLYPSSVRLRATEANGRPFASKAERRVADIPISDPPRPARRLVRWLP